MRKRKINILPFLAGTIFLLTACGNVSSSQGSKGCTETGTETAFSAAEADRGKSVPVLETAAGKVSYEFCEQIVQNCLQRNEREDDCFFLSQITLCDYDKDGYAEAALFGMDGPYGLTVILDSGKQNPYITQYRGALPKPYRKEKTGETVYLGLMQHWISGDCMNMGIVELQKDGGLQVQYPAAASLRSGYIGGGFQHFGFDVYTDCSAEDFMMLQTTAGSIDEKRAHEQYHSTFYSGMEFGNYSVLLRGYAPLREENGQFTVNYPCEEAEGAGSKDYADSGEKVSADVLYKLFEFPEPVPSIEPFDFTDSASGNIRSINDVQSDESGISVSNGSGISYMQCLRAAEYVYGGKSEYSFTVTPCDENRDGWNELYLYMGHIENENIPGIVIREDGTREDVMLSASDYNPSGLEFHGEFVASLSPYPWYYQEYRDAETAAREIYLMLTNTDTN